MQAESSKRTKGFTTALLMFAVGASMMLCGGMIRGTPDMDAIGTVMVPIGVVLIVAGIILRLLS